MNQLNNKTVLINQLNPDSYPMLFNLLSLCDVIDSQTTVLDLDSDTQINLCSLIEEARKELGW